MRRLSITGMAVMLLLWLIPVQALAAPAAKWEVCHIQGNGTYHAIEVAVKALPAHLDHGDGLLGQPIPELPGYRFGEDCDPVPFCLAPGAPLFKQAIPNPTSYTYDVDFCVMVYSGFGNTGTVNFVPVDLSLTDPSNSTSGCEFGDFPTTVKDNIALIQRSGVCLFETKVQNAEAAGAVGVVIFNQGDTPSREGLFVGTLLTQRSIPVVATTFAIGVDLSSGATGSLEVYASYP